MCIVLLTSGVNPIAVKKYIISYIISYALRNVLPSLGNWGRSAQEGHDAGVNQMQYTTLDSTTVNCETAL